MLMMPTAFFCITLKYYHCMRMDEVLIDLLLGPQTHKLVSLWARSSGPSWRRASDSVAVSLRSSSENAASSSRNDLKKDSRSVVLPRPASPTTIRLNDSCGGSRSDLTQRGACTNLTRVARWLRGTRTAAAAATHLCLRERARCGRQLLEAGLAEAEVEALEAGQGLEVDQRPLGADAQLGLQALAWR